MTVACCLLLPAGVLVQVVMDPPVRPPRIAVAEDLSAAMLLDRYASARMMLPEALKLAQVALQVRS